MTTGHILPGFGDPVSRLRRARSAGCYPLDSATLLDLKNAAKLNQREFDSIRENARQLWSQNSLRPTTYDTFFSDGMIRDITHSRPTSSHRHNNPHPPHVFLTNRLHYIEGYHNPDTTLGKHAYQIDASLSQTAQAQRRAPRVKYIARPDSSAVNQFKDPFGFKKILPPREAQAAEAWVKIADDEDKDRVLEVVREQAEQKPHVLQDQDCGIRPKTAHPSLHRWMRLAGAEENAAVSRIMQTLQSSPTRQYERCTYSPRSMGHKRKEEIAAHGSYRLTPQLKRGEFSMHPDWPTSLPHHKVP